MTSHHGSSPTLQAAALAIEAGVPVLLWGSPGSGKSSSIAALADVLGRHCETVIASIREPSDFAGLPVVADGSVTFAPPRWAENLASSDQGLLFLDEISTAPPAVQAALLRVVLERAVGDLPLPPSTSVVAAANPPEQAADGWDLAAALANRFCHLDWAIDATTIAEGLAAGFPPPQAPVLPANWDAIAVQARANVSAFLMLRPSLVSALPSDVSAAGQAWPSPRTWEMAAQLLGAARAAQAAESVVAMLVTGCVGTAAGMEFLGWLQDIDVPDPEFLLAAPADAVIPERGDLAWAVLTAVAAAVAARPTPERWAAGWQILGKAAETAPDVGAMAARVLAKCRPDGAETPAAAAAFLPVLRSAGLV